MTPFKSLLLVVTLWLFQSTAVKAQQHPGSLELGPFYYGMHIHDVLGSGFDVIHNEQSSDGTYVLGLMLNETKQTYAIIQFPPFRMPYAYAIQITGYDQNQVLFDDLTLGMTKNELFTHLGIPSDSSYIQQRNIMMYTYDNGNYSFEVHEDSGLYSFAIRGDDSLLRYFGFNENWLNYRLMRIPQVVSMYAPDENNLPMILFNATSFRPRVQFTGNTRPTMASSRQILTLWGNSRNFDEQILASYSVEIEVTDVNLSYWIMMDERMLPDLISETQNGRIPVDLFAVLIGFNEDGPVMISSEFVTF